jgi:hypothetical protein
MILYILLLILILCCNIKDLIFMIMIVLVLKIILKENHKKKSMINLMEKSTPMYYDMPQMEDMETFLNNEKIQNNKESKNEGSQGSNDSGNSLDVNLDNKSLDNKNLEQNNDRLLAESLDILLEKLETSNFARPNVNDADDVMCDRMAYSSIQSKHALNNRAKYNKYSIMPYFDSELRANEERDWWDRETDYLDAFM